MLALLIASVILAVSGCASLPNHFEPAPQQQSKAVVFDIDGTITPTPLRFWQAREDAAQAVQFYADQGYQIFYVTARVTWLQRQIPGWLKDNHFPPGGLYLTQTSEDRDDHAAYKIRILQRLKADGWQIEWAFGDSSSDFEAYGAAGIPKERVVALQREGYEQCEPGVWERCLKTWREWLRR